MNQVLLKMGLVIAEDILVNASPTLVHASSGKEMTLCLADVAKAFLRPQPAVAFASAKLSSRVLMSLIFQDLTA